jgi:hypothetical protein
MENIMMSRSKPTTAADADRAGGQEIVYSSESLGPALSIPPPVVPKSISDIVHHDEKNPAEAMIDTTAVRAEQAFEMFAGKVYTSSTKNIPLSSSLSPSSSSMLKSTSWNNETPMERLTRLSLELSELENEMKLSSSSSSRLGENSVQDDTVHDLPNVVMSLRDRLQRTTSLWPKYESSRLQSLMKDATVLLSQDDTKSSSGSNEVTASSSAVSATRVDPEIEARIQRLETLIEITNATTMSGSKSGITSTTTSDDTMATRLLKMESFVNSLDISTVNQVSAKAKVLRQDLEAATKARTKLMQGGGSSAGMVSAADQMKIQQLYDVYQSLQGMNTHLPVLAQRLHSLKVQHQNVNTFGTRLYECETLVEQLKTHDVPALSVAIQSLEDGWSSNVKQLQSNLSSLDDRIQQLRNG